jgi:hypothetical protein
LTGPDDSAVSLINVSSHPHLDRAPIVEAVVNETRETGWDRGDAAPVRQNSIVKQAAFLPDRHQRLSVIRSCELTEIALWQLGNQAPSGRNLHGAGIMTAGEVEQTSLPPRHTNIVGWSAGKDEQKSLALQLSSKAKLVLRNADIPGA